MNESSHPDSNVPLIRVMIADDHESVRQGLRALFGATAGVEVVEEVGDTDAVLDRIRTVRLDVVVMDLSMPPSGGLETIRKIHAETPHIAVVAFTRYSDPAFVREALASGASGYVLKQSSFAELRRAVEAVMRGTQYVDPLLATVNLLPVEDAGALTVRERDVLRRTALGQSNKEIASTLSISVRTVEVHKTHGMRKLALRDRTDLVRYASVQGWLTEP